MVVRELSGQKVKADVTAVRFFLRKSGKVLANRPRQAGCLDVEHHGRRIDLLDRLDRVDDASRDLHHYADITLFAAKIRWPETAHSAHQGSDDRLVERRVPADEILIPLRKRSRISSDIS